MFLNNVDNKSLEEDTGKFTNNVEANIGNEEDKELTKQQSKMTPIEALEKLKEKQNAEFNIDYCSNKGCFTGFLKINDIKYTADYEYFKDHSYAKNKTAMELLSAASFANDFANKLYQDLRKKPYFAFGGRFPFPESSNIELKGGSDENKPMLENKAKALQLITKYGKTLCGFLNAGKGGSLYVGVHDNTMKIQGVAITNIDKFSLNIRNSIMDRMDPKNHYTIDIQFHTVGKQLNGSYDSNSPSSYVVEIRAAKENRLFLFEGCGYVRDGNQTRVMTADDICNRVRHQDACNRVHQQNAQLKPSSCLCFIL